MQHSAWLLRCAHLIRNTNSGLCDVTILCNGRAIYAHKLILAVYSKLLAAKILTATSSSNITLDISYLALQTLVVEQLVDFMYTGIIRDMMNATEVHRTASILGMPLAVDYLKQYVHVTSLADDNMYVACEFTDENAKMTFSQIFAEDMSCFKNSVDAEVQVDVVALQIAAVGNVTSNVYALSNAVSDSNCNALTIKNDNNVQLPVNVNTFRCKETSLSTDRFEEHSLKLENDKDNRASDKSVLSIDASIQERQSKNNKTAKVKPKKKNSDTNGCKTVPKQLYSQYLMNGVYSCPFCEFKTDLYRTFRKHSQQHKEMERPFQCEQCVKSFKEKKHLKAHMKTHSSMLYSLGLLSAKFVRGILLLVYFAE